MKLAKSKQAKGKTKSSQAPALKHTKYGYGVRLEISMVEYHRDSDNPRVVHYFNSVDDLGTNRSPLIANINLPGVTAADAYASASDFVKKLSEQDKAPAEPKGLAQAICTAFAKTLGLWQKSKAERGNSVVYQPNAEEDL